ncbi:MAG: hypothetical protein U1F60_02995 [Planctomycetota bacterium]
MSYDPKTRTIRLDSSRPASIMADMGVYFTSVTMEIGSMPDAPAGLARDARILRDWLCLGSGVLPESAMERVRIAFMAYMTIRIFALSSDRMDLGEARRQLPPAAVVQVFDGMGLAGGMQDTTAAIRSPLAALPAPSPASESCPSLARRLGRGLRRLFG